MRLTHPFLRTWLCRTRVLLTAAGALLVGSMPAPASIDGSFILNGDGTVTYTYEVNNLAGLFDVGLWSLDFEFPTPDWDQHDTFSGGDVAVPDANWFAEAGIPVLGLSAQDFLSIDPVADVGIGDVLGGFSFTSRYPPGNITYYEFSASGDTATGTTLGPVGLIPEGGSWAAGFVLAALMAFAAGGRIRRSAVPSE